mmetsp:Transcript_32935/g.87610  ORF Transcript_32935/g.87610 Transcript_32935/m.87610 type:complete len:665 (+) Transcript_32935:443-2437(+)
MDDGILVGEDCGPSWRSTSFEHERLRVYSDIFEEVISRDEQFGPTLRQVKNVYDTFLQQAQAALGSSPSNTSSAGGYVVGGAVASNAKATIPTPPVARGSENSLGHSADDVTAGSAQSQLERENWELRRFAEKLQQELQEERSLRKALAITGGAGAGGTNSAASSGAMPPGGSSSRACWAPPPPFQAAALGPGARISVSSPVRPAAVDGRAGSAGLTPGVVETPVPPNPQLPGPPAFGIGALQDARQRRRTAPPGATLSRQASQPMLLSWTEPPETDEDSPTSQCHSPPPAPKVPGPPAAPAAPTAYSAAVPVVQPAVVEAVAASGARGAPGGKAEGQHRPGPADREGAGGRGPGAGGEGGAAGRGRPAQRRPPNVPALAFSRLPSPPEASVEAHAPIVGPPPPPKLAGPPPAPTAWELSVGGSSVGVDEAEDAWLDGDYLPQRSPFGQGPRPSSVPPLDLAAAAVPEEADEDADQMAPAQQPPSVVSAGGRQAGWSGRSASSSSSGLSAGSSSRAEMDLPDVRLVDKVNGPYQGNGVFRIASSGEPGHASCPIPAVAPLAATTAFRPCTGSAVKAVAGAARALAAYPAPPSRTASSPALVTTAQVSVATAMATAGEFRWQRPFGGYFGATATAQAAPVASEKHSAAGVVTSTAWLAKQLAQVR